MKEIKANIDNIRKAVFQYTLGNNRDLRGATSEERQYELSEVFIKRLEETNKIERLSSFISGNTSIPDDQAFSYVLGFCLWDGKAVFKIGSYYFSVKLSYGSLLPYFNRISLKESYDLVKSANFTERDYQDEKDLGSYFEPLEPTASKQTILEVNEEVLLNHWTNTEQHDLVSFMNYNSTLGTLYAISSSLIGEAVIKTDKETIDLKELERIIPNEQEPYGV